ncbi:coniferyl aldehyde dehydrogenase [Celeribacter marinus]|uniref:coniferyl aldehyde dehydrogenase n=1 Tax=Celeribacter marinus TaxID=1397108 RepID=UPI0031781A5D
MSDLISTFQNMKAAHATARATLSVTTAKQRTAQLTALETALLAHEDRLIAAMNTDFSHRSVQECRTFDITTSLSEIRSNRKQLKSWMRARRVRTPLQFRPATCEIRPQPLGVVGIIAPWNFPVYLAVAPVAAALAAGNRVMIKPSELSPRTSEALANMMYATFAPDVVSVITGGADVAATFSALPFDHLLFTGSTAIGRIVAQAAAQNLTPVTLELGGKSPAILMPSADLDRAARRIAWGKAASAGQICVAPDYVLVPRSLMQAAADAILGAWAKFYPDGSKGDDYSAIISERHLERLHTLLNEAKGRGAQSLSNEPDGPIAGTRKFAPVVVLDPPLDTTLMREEIFGPILPLIPYDTPQEALDFVGARDHPLALYVFANDRDEQELWLNGSISGGVTINDTVIHVSVDTLPFGGVGASGMGAYHGRHGFETFSHMKSVVRQAKWNGMFVTEPPFKGWKARTLNALRKVI